MLEGDGILAFVRSYRPGWRCAAAPADSPSALAKTTPGESINLTCLSSLISGGLSDLHVERVAHRCALQVAHRVDETRFTDVWLLRCQR